MIMSFSRLISRSVYLNRGRFSINSQRSGSDVEERVFLWIPCAKMCLFTVTLAYLSLA